MTVLVLFSPTMHLSSPLLTPSRPPGKVHPCQVFLHRPGVQERDAGRHPPGRVSPDRGGGGRLRPHAGGPDGGAAPVLHQTRYG